MPGFDLGGHLAIVLMSKLNTCCTSAVFPNFAQ